MRADHMRPDEDWLETRSDGGHTAEVDELRAVWIAALRLLIDDAARAACSGDDIHGALLQIRTNGAQLRWLCRNANIEPQFVRDTLDRMTGARRCTDQHTPHTRPQLPPPVIT